MKHVVDRDSLPLFPVGPLGSNAAILNGGQYEFPGVSLMRAELQPGEGPALHRHDYNEVFAIAQGRVSFTIGDIVVEADQDQVVLVPAGIPHSFRNAGTDVLRLTAIHVAPRVEIEWLEKPWMPDDRA